VFWCLSGIVFAHVYQTALIERSVSSIDFIWRRFARLYPLHIVTLILVFILQWLFISTTDLPYFIYQFNNMKHFVLNIIFANYWGFQDGTSFNGPVWSISIELIAYSVFLLVTMFIRILPQIFQARTFQLVLWSGMLWLCLSKMTTSSGFVLDCISLFALGVILYNSWMILPNFIVLMTILYLLLSYHINDSLSRSFEELGIPFTSLMIAIFVSLLHFSSLFSRLRTGRLLAMNLGKITYAMYIVHFPIQLLMVLFSENLMTLDFLSEPVLLSFLSLTLLVSHLCYSFFEFPVQKALRSWYSNLKF
jgi:peptidoglycan/LPS O-acetylase OafA/YrhL